MRFINFCTLVGMKLFLSILTILVTFVVNAQNVKKIIDKGDIQGLAKYIDAQAEIYSEVFLQDVDQYVHPMVYASAKEEFEMVKLFVKNKDKIDDFHSIMSIAFAVSLSTNNNKLIEYLYSLDPNINERCETCHGHTAIMIATVYRNENWYFKLKPKSELTLLSQDNNNLLQLATSIDYPINYNIVKDVLTIESLNFNQVNVQNRTALQNSAIAGNDTLYFMLKEFGLLPESERNLFIDAVIGTNFNIYNDVYNEKYLWELFSFDWMEEFNEYYPLELAIENNGTKITTSMLDVMFRSLEGNNKYIDILYSILNTRDIGDYYFYPLWEAAQWKNRKLFRLILESMVKFNDMTLELTEGEVELDPDFFIEAQILFTKFDYRSAKRNLGKEFTVNLYKELGIDF